MQNKYRQLIIAFIFFLAVLAGYGYYSFLVEKERINTRVNASLVRSSHLAERIVGNSYHQSIAHTPPNDAEYRKILDELSDIARIEGVKYIYTLIKDENGTFHFTSSSATDEELRTQKNLTYFYDVYDADPAIDRALMEQKALTANVTDAWGEFRSLFVGHTTSEHQQYVIGVDIETSSIEQISRQEAFRSVGKAIVLIFAALPIFFLYRKLLSTYQFELQQKVQSATADYEKARDDAVIAMNQAQKANRAKDQFLSSMSHELRTPLNAIIGFSQILMIKKDIADETKNMIEKILFSGKNLLALVNTILDFSKIESGTTEVNYSTFSVREFIDEIGVLIEPQAQKKNITIDSEIQQTEMITADRGLLGQVVVNLLSNAIKFSPEGSIVTIRHSSTRQFHHFEIIDQGSGISDEDKMRLFEPFVQLRENQTDAIKGTGLGLSIAKRIVTMHNGEIFIENTNAKGSTFCFTIPKNG